MPDAACRCRRRLSKKPTHTPTSCSANSVQGATQQHLDKLLPCPNDSVELDLSFGADSSESSNDADLLLESGHGNAHDFVDGFLRASC